MKQFILVLLLIVLTSAETFNPTTDFCACEKIKSEIDCRTVYICAWTPAVPATDTTVAITGFCVDIRTDPSALAHCPQVSDPVTNCWKTLGCAYIDSMCTHFTGCTAYVKTTNSECQAISNLCTTDGTQCINTKACNDYIMEAQCTTNTSISGILKCKWENNACRDYVCTEAVTTLTTNIACNNWLSGCVTTGKGCIPTLGVCALYIGDDMACSGLIGTDGNCEGVVSGTNCTTRVCSQAPVTLVTDSDCNTYQVGCITNGKGCISSPLPACASYSGDNITCEGYIGSDGICEGDIGATNCRSRTCTNALPLNATDALCDAYKIGCVTNGKGCVASKSACSSYSGTTITCVGYIGSDGYCKGTDLLINSPCAPKVCSDAPITLFNDAGCVQFQLGCKSTGKGCVLALGLCSSYFGTTTTCEGYIGSDGKCKGTTIDTTCDGELDLFGNCTGIFSPCAPRICTEAPTSTTTNQACASYQTGCVTTGSGCVAVAGCLDTIKALTCIGAEGCGWNNICVMSQNCSDFKTTSICNGYSAILVSGETTTTIPCFWTGSVCRNLACTDAPSTINSDSLCNTFLSGCLTNGNGCLAPTAPCSSYYGTRAICSIFTRKCYNNEGASATTACTERVCSDDNASTTDLACNTFKPDCRTKGTGCIDPSKLCSDYSGIQSACDTFRGNNGTIRCWSLSNTVSSTCLDKTCAHLASATSNMNCEVFLSGCLFNGAGCVTKSQPCSAYTGTQSQCNSFKANNGADTCWNLSTTVSGSCIVKNCGHSGALTTDAECKAFLESCLTTGSGCITKTSPCSSYFGTVNECEAFTGDSIRCYKFDFCADRVCTDKASGIVNNDECTTYLASCRHFNGGCVNKNICTNYNGDTLAKCQDVFDNSIIPQKCWWLTNGTTCIPRTCANAPIVASQQNCTDHLVNCIYNGSICLTQGVCASYTVYGNDTTTKQTNCGVMKNSSSKYCWSSGGTYCEERTCDNVPSPTSKSSCDDHIGDLTSCQWNGIACVSSNICTNYTPTGAGDLAKLAICQAMKDTSSTPINCYYSTGTWTCESKSCSNVPNPTSQSSCDNHVSGKCGWNGATCVVLGNCNSYTPTGGSDTIKKTICDALKNGDSTPEKCTFITGTSTCVNRTCENIVTPTSNTDCIQWIAKCQWNGQDCAQSASTTCQPRVCTTITSPQTLSDCTNFSSTCRWSGIGPCVTADICTQYTVIALSGVAQCGALTDTLGAICSYTSSTTCAVPACGNKTNAINQGECTIQGIACRYVGLGTCVNAVPCTYNVSAITGDSARKAACDNAFDTSGTVQCSFIPGADLCNPRAGCPSYYATSLAICNQIIDLNGIPCNYTSATTCRATVCADKTNATKLTDCTDFLPQCRYVGVGICLTKAFCAYDVGTIGSDLAKKTLCESLTDPNNVHCAFVPAAASCSPRVVCSSYAGSSLDTCSKIVDLHGNLCNYSAGVICTDGACSDKFDAISVNDCAIQGDGCRYVGVPTCVVASACANYSVSGTNTVQMSLCSAITDVEGRICTWELGTTGACAARTCSNIISANSNADCIAWIDTCTFTGTGCITKAVCGDYTPTGLDNTAKRSYCSAILDNNSPQVQCGYTDNANNCESRSCTNSGPLNSELACKAWLKICTYNGVSCLVAAACDSYTLSSLSNANTNQALFDQCRAIKDSIGDGCDLKVKTCSSITPPPTSSQDCLNWFTTCRFTGNTCVEAVACTYTLTGAYASVAKSNEEKIAFCNNLEDNTDSTPKIFCTLTAPVASGTVCIPRTCSNMSFTPNSYDDCTNWLNSCTYNGAVCVLSMACSSYTSTGSNDATRAPQCKLMKNSSGALCGFVTGMNQTTCVDRSCNNAPTPTSDIDCSGYKEGCTISNASTPICLVNTSACTLFSGLPGQCQSQIGNSLKCWSVSLTSTSQACKQRECTDNTTFTTNDECESFLSGCKTNGAGCVLNSVNCSSLLGNSSTCMNFKASDGTSLCKSGNSLPDSCRDKVCSDNTSYIQDVQCQLFKDGCLTNGQGCISSTEPCSRYQGIQSTCSGFVGNGKKCWNSSTITTAYCVDKKCSDDINSTTDTACNSSLADCVTKGTGCIEKTVGCGSYQGLQATCSAFKGENGTKLCWNIDEATATTPCIDKACSHNTSATSDTDCETFLPRATGATNPKCVTSGIGCVIYPRSCSGFTGTLEKCGTFTAVDGPCKTTATGSASAPGICTPRICSEALNSNNTDYLCGAFHPTCVTTGYGCATSVICSTIQEQNSCSAKLGCSWVSNCRSINTDCSSLTASGASICVNTPVSTGSKKCSWYNGTTCRAQTCDDLPATLTSHNSCSFAFSTCTTTGQGCITMGACSGYVTEVICQKAKTTDPGDTCVWDTNVCRTKQCTDAPIGLTTDAGCHSYLNGCMTNGTSCVTSVTCSTLLTFAACQVDGNGNPCLFVNGLCYSYSKCEDVVMTIHQACQQFSPLCTTDGVQCIAITTCAKTIDQISCVVGTDGICGWQLTNGVNPARCQKFVACSDILATENYICQNYSHNCITDGTKCIETTICSNYITQIACEFNGSCQFVTSSSTCRLRQCTDATAMNSIGGITTHTGCYSFQASSKCTTNGTSCIDFQVCASYTVVVGCFEGTDGLCIYALPIGQTTGTMACRVKVCEDLILDTSISCKIALFETKLGTKCVSNGTTCIVENTCSSYTSKEACNGGGTDGNCAYTPESITNIGTCKLMTACTDANYDPFACLSNQQACHWQEATLNNLITSCNPHTCITKATISICNPVPSFDLQTYTICGPSTTGGCTEVEGNTLLASTCQVYTLQTFVWDEANQKCIACFSSSSTVPGEGTTTNGKIIKSIIPLVILAILGA